MNPERIVGGLDIGSAKTTALIAEVVGDRQHSAMVKILGVGQARTTGLRRGIVSDIEETTRSIKKAIQDIRQARDDREVQAIRERIDQELAALLAKEK